MSILSHYFRRRRSLAMGFSTVGGSVGGYALSVSCSTPADTSLQHLLPDHAEQAVCLRGVRVRRSSQSVPPFSGNSRTDPSFLAAAFLNLGCLVIANAILRPRLPCRKSHIPAPSAISMFSEARYAIACAGAFFIAMGSVSSFRSFAGH